MKKYKISKSIAWQAYDELDLLIVLNRKNKEFYFFQETGKLIAHQLLSGAGINNITEKCMQLFDVNINEVTKSINDLLIKIWL